MRIKSILKNIFIPFWEFVKLVLVYLDIIFFPILGKFKNMFLRIINGTGELTIVDFSVRLKGEDVRFSSI